LEIENVQICVAAIGANESNLVARRRKDDGRHDLVTGGRVVSPGNRRRSGGAASVKVRERNYGSLTCRSSQTRVEDGKVSATGSPVKAEFGWIVPPANRPAGAQRNVPIAVKTSAFVGG
jgi:hypothetical protein